MRGAAFTIIRFSEHLGANIRPKRARSLFITIKVLEPRHLLCHRIASYIIAITIRRSDDRLTDRSITLEPIRVIMWNINYDVRKRLAYQL